MLTIIKKRSALLIALAVVSATVALVPQSASAAATVNPALATAPVAPEDTENMVACPGDSAPAAGFSDTTSTDVDCIKMFGVTQGTTATTYEPDGTVPRWQMALFIHRMFTPAGVAAAGTTTVPAFTDTAGLSAEIQAAVTALASHAITLGTSATTFGPDDNVTREQMAMFLSRFADIAKDHAGSAIQSEKGTGKYNYKDIASSSFEGMESIIRLFNIGVTEGYCLAASCSQSYRPSDDITRAEMASMMTNLLNHTNARPAGVTIQTNTAAATAAPQATATMISVRNADFTPVGNALVDEFYQLHNDLTTAVAPFGALGTVSAGTSNAKGSIKGTIDATDYSMDAYGNKAGHSQTTASNKTANWWVHTGNSGGQFIDGTTVHDKLSISFGTASALVDADRVTVTSDAGTAGATSKSAHALIATTDGINTWAGNSRTFTLTMRDDDATTATVKDGYSIKVTEAKVDYLSNASVAVSYLTPSAGVTSYTVTCPADDSALNTNWWVAYSVKFEIGAAVGTGLPTGTTIDPFDDDGAGDNYGSTTWSTGVTGNGDQVGVTCDDETRAYLAGSETLSINDNATTLSTAGTMASITATASDQYGKGMAGLGVQFTSARTAAATGAVTTTANVAQLTTDASGVATLSSVVCATGERQVLWTVTDPGGAYIDAIDNTNANPTNLIEGQTVFCNSAGTDQSIPGSYAGVDCVIKMILGQAGSDDGDLRLQYGGQATAALAHDGIGDAAIQGALRGLSTLHTDVTVTLAVLTYTITIPGKFVCSALTATGSDLHVNAGPTATTVTIHQDGTNSSVLGQSATTHKFLDENVAANEFYTIRTQTNQGADGQAETTTGVTYHKWGYDDTDTWSSAAVNGMTEAQFETAIAAITNQAQAISLTYRTGALTTGISAFLIG